MEPGAVVDAIATGGSGNRSFNIVCYREESVGTTMPRTDPYNASGALDANIQSAKMAMEVYGDSRIQSLTMGKYKDSVEKIRIDYSATSILSMSDTTVGIAVNSGMQSKVCTDGIVKLLSRGVDVAMIKAVLIGDVKYQVTWSSKVMLTDAEKMVILVDLQHEFGAEMSGGMNLVGRNVYWPFVGVPVDMFLPPM
jgi:hypothetical protein